MRKTIVLCLSAAMLASTACNPVVQSHSHPKPVVDRIVSSNGRAWSRLWSDEFEYEGLPDNPGIRWYFEYIFQKSM